MSATDHTTAKGTTAFAPAERAGLEELQASIRTAANSQLVSTLLEATDVVPLLLNRNRQVVAFNERALQRLGFGRTEGILGLRPGEFMACSNVPGSPCGCGTGESCRDCGLVGAVLAAQESGRPAEQECLLTVQRDGHDTALELRVRATPLWLEDEQFLFVGLRDISDQKRRQVLERVFLHDVRNTAAGLLGWAQVLSARSGRDAGDGGADQAAPRILRLAQRLVRELQDQHDLVLAEAGNLQPGYEQVPVAAILEEAAETFAVVHEARHRVLEVTAPDPSMLIETDRRLVVRVLVNMLKNAFEATRRGQRIRLGARCEEDVWSLFVQNEGELDPDVRRHIFQRSFSTKAGTGRGLGTYSMKLFGERHLGGVVSFTSNPEEGTVFSIRLPQQRRPGRGPS